MTRCLILAVLMSCTLAVAQDESAIRDRLVGTWKLVSTEETLKDGSTRPYSEYGPNGKGILMYSHDGYMCADLVNPDRPKWVTHVKPTLEERAVAGEGSFAYCGRYQIDTEASRIIHLPEVATDPGWVGTTQIRPYKFEGDRLVLSDVEKEKPGVVRWKIVWEKVR